MGCGGAATGAGFLLLTKPGNTNIKLFRQKQLLPLKNSNITVITSSSSSHRKDSNAETIWSKKFKFKFTDKNKRNRESNSIDGQQETEEEEEEGSRRKKRKKRRWLSDKPPRVIEEEEEASNVWKELIDSVWILEVFKSYGWALPPIIVSWLLATGPKAFLMTLAIPVGQSVVTFVFMKLWGTTHSKRNHNARKRRKPLASWSNSPPSDIEDEVEEWEKTVMKTKGFQSWVGDDDVSINKESQEELSFGGWDELDGIESMQYRPQTRRVNQSQRKQSQNGVLGKRGRSSDAPLLLRLLVAIFPFLDFWTKIL